MNYFIGALVLAILIEVIRDWSKLTTLNPKPNYGAWGVLLALLLSAYFGCKEHESSNTQIEHLSFQVDSTSTALTDSLSKLHGLSKGMDGKLDSTGVELQRSIALLNDIKEAMQKSNLGYDGSSKRLVPLTVKSQFNLPGAIFNAPVQQGNGNTQNN